MHLRPISGSGVDRVGAGRSVAKAGDGVVDQFIVVSLIGDAGLIKGVGHRVVGDGVADHLYVRRSGRWVAIRVDLGQPDADVITRERIVHDLVAGAVGAVVIRPRHQQNTAGRVPSRAGVSVLRDVISLHHRRGAEPDLDPVLGDIWLRAKAGNGILRDRRVRVAIHHDARLLVTADDVAVDAHPDRRGRRAEVAHFNRVPFLAAAQGMTGVGELFDVRHFRVRDRARSAVKENAPEPARPGVTDVNEVVSSDLDVGNVRGRAAVLNDAAHENGRRRDRPP